MLWVASTVEQGEVSLSRCLENTLPDLGIVIKFSKVAAPELYPLGGFMAEPASQRIAWGYVLQPAIKREAFFL